MTATAEPAQDTPALAIALLRYIETRPGEIGQKFADALRRAMAEPDLQVTLPEDGRGLGGGFYNIIARSDSGVNLPALKCAGLVTDNKIFSLKMGPIAVALSGSKGAEKARDEYLPDTLKNLETNGKTHC